MDEIEIREDDVYVERRYLRGRPLVQCDDDACRAFDEPSGEAELRAACEHWRSHSYLGGCSHAR